MFRKKEIITSVSIGLSVVLSTFITSLSPVYADTILGNSFVDISVHRPKDSKVVAVQGVIIGPDGEISQIDCKTVNTDIKVKLASYGASLSKRFAYVYLGMYLDKECKNQVSVAKLEVTKPGETLIEMEYRTLTVDVNSLGKDGGDPRESK